MNLFFQKLSFYKLKAISYKLNKGMTYVELIVVLSIFATMSSIVLFNYGTFQAKVDIKNLASDVALQIVQAQKASLSGQLPTQTPTLPDPTQWKPSYGVSFDTTNSTQFVYFTDLNNKDGYEAGTEFLNTLYITKNNSIFKINKCTSVPCDINSGVVNPVAIIFKRPDSGVAFYSGINKLDPAIDLFQYIQITVSSPNNNATAKIKVYPSGRIQIN